MHINRKNMGTFFPIPRRGSKYVAVPTHNQHESIPLIVVMRDMLKLVKTKKELKKVLSEKQIMINHKEIRETNYPLGLFDILTLRSVKKQYIAMLNEHKKIILKEISAAEAERKVFKVIGKTVLKGNKTQINLLHGMNVLLKESVSVNDSVVYNFSKNKVEKVIKMEKGKKAYVMKGKHAGAEGIIENIVERGGKKIVKIVDKHEKINVWVKNIIVME
jgi:small subunit ribosomal protein S4e